MNIENAFAAVLKDLRTQKKISQENLAFLSGLDRTYISLLERGKRQPTLTSLFSISKALDMTLVDLTTALEEKINENQTDQDFDKHI
ncbi:helix-turn-helix domain-containing protein [Acinetobacter baumannii]|uniref:helix-turn-helix domain-containing protein n=1 Tax=Acinetobacter baumannii TaxID=470 RepID=UPI00222227AA|nr:helix-turn-helix transcriptional regulator [Acinetobacter baumannii]MCW1515747.1 helix-turn-helix domain-containing protein [Acinetobacter baumannii]MDR9548443.1 helix-turn-helix transcriptional regulator [Acinetobacter baumannii]